MRRLLLIVGLLVLVVVGLLVSWRQERVSLGEALVADVASLQARPLERVAQSERPTHEDAFRCLGGMLDVTPGRLPPQPQSARAVLEGSAPPDEAVRGWLQAHSAWVAGLRACSDSKKLSYADGLTPWPGGGALRRQRLQPALVDLLDFTALELPVLLADGKTDLALERCAQTLSLFVDQSQLGLTGAERTRAAVYRLAPACGGALVAADGTSRKAVAGEWSAQQARLVSPGRLVLLERVALGYGLFSAAAEEAQRARLGEGLPPPAESWWRRLQLGRAWAGWDVAMRKLEVVANTPGPERDAAIHAVDASLPPSVAAATNYGPAFVQLGETRAVLGLLAALALGEATLPGGATRSEAGVTFVDSVGSKVVLPAVPPLPAEQPKQPAPEAPPPAPEAPPPAP